MSTPVIVNLVYSKQWGSPPSVIDMRFYPRYVLILMGLMTAILMPLVGSIREDALRIRCLMSWR